MKKFKSANGDPGSVSLIVVQRVVTELKVVRVNVSVRKKAISAVKAQTPKMTAATQNHAHVMFIIDNLTPTLSAYTFFGKKATLLAKKLQMF